MSEENEQIEQITPEPIEYKAKPPEVDPVFGHPVAATGRANQVWREDIGMSLAAADELTAKTRETAQEFDHSELMDNDPAYKEQAAELEKTSFEQQPEPQDIDRRAEPKERDAATVEMFEQERDAVDGRRAAFLQHLEEKIESKQTQEQSKSIGI